MKRKSFLSFLFFTSALQCVTSLQNVDNNFQQERLYRDRWSYTNFVSIYCCSFKVWSCKLWHQWNFGITLPMLGLLHQHEDRQIECPAIETNDVPLPETILTGLPGWPRYSITTEQICHCVSTVMAWQGIASCFGISRRTLYRQTISWNGATDIV